jgi:hypothetical protein
MDITTTNGTVVPTSKPKPVHYGKHEIRDVLRKLIQTTDAGKVVKAFGNLRVSWGRRFHKGVGGRWSPILMIEVPKARDRARDVVVLSAEDAAGYLHPLVNKAA